MSWDARLHSWFRIALVLGAIVALGAASAHAVSQGEWVPTGAPLDIPSMGCCSSIGGGALVVADGSALLFGEVTGSVQAYDPETGGWVRRGSLRVSRGGGATATVLADGVLLAGGIDHGGTVQAAAEIYDPATGTSALTGSMRLARLFHRATMLASGTVLVSGGVSASGGLIGSAEIFDPRTGTWTLTGALNHPRRDHGAVLLPSGKVLVFGGDDGSGAPFIASTELYDPATGAWTLAAPMDTDRLGEGGAALGDGRVLIAGFSSALGESSERYDEASGTWAPSVAMPATIGGTLVLLRDGTSLAAGCRGSRTACLAGTAALYDVAAGTWIVTPSHRAAGPLAVLPDGRVLRVGGFSADLFFGSGPLVADLFRPDNSTPRLAVETSLDFGAAHPGRVVERSVAVRNTGEATLSGSVSTSPPFAVVAGSPFTLGPGQRTNVIVRFAAPATPGPYTGVGRFSSNGNWPEVSMTAAVGVQLSGRITGENGAGLAGVTVELGGASTATTFSDADGDYRFVVALNARYTLTPAGSGLGFAPRALAVDVGTQDLDGLDFTAATVGDRVDMFTTALYEAALGRGPDLAGLELSSSFLRGHCDADGVRALAQGFFDSVEFRASRPLTLAGLVTAIYRALLGRDPDPGGLAAFGEVFRSDRGALATVFVGSPEFTGVLPDRSDRTALAALITRFYEELLGRAPDPSEVAAWVDAVVATRDVSSVARAFVVSAEFEARALTHRGYVTLLYRAVLGREPDQAGLDAFEQTLRSRLLAVIDTGFIASSEFQARMTALCGS
jgi:hypothetical protein